MLYAVMGLIDKQKSSTETQSGPQNQVNIDKFKDLTKEEYEKLFEALKDISVKGADIETIYNAIVKLQQQYILKYGK